MSTLQPTSQGKLAVEVKSDSEFYSRNVPIEIRDASMLLVGRGRGRSFELPIGLYQVSAVLEDGQEHSQLVHVRADDTAVVTLAWRKSDLGVRGAISGGGWFAKRRSAYALISRFRQRGSAVEKGGPFAMSRVPLPPASLEAVDGAKLVGSRGAIWYFECLNSLTAVATATILVGRQRLSISLPSSPQTKESRLCEVWIDDLPNGPEATVWISPERTVANALQNMLASGHLAPASIVADEAVELLRDKYSDPTGAALAALIVRKVGRLARFEKWLENLARDFAWLPDGKILLASVLFERRTDLDRALSLAAEAATQRILYTECYSILLDLLRRWPNKENWSGYADTIASLASAAPYVDWNSNCFTQVLES